ncbi:5'-methylthioadenosine/S-adenosylhomocysteine nucleosidase [Buchnera aphidicola (Takecallis arundicolens)]
MKIGIIYAMEEEIRAYYYNVKKFKKIQNETYGINIYISNSNKIILIKSGIGKVSSSIACTILIHTYKVHIIINIGSSGALKPYINISNFIIGKNISYHDVNLTSFQYKIGQIPGFPQKFNTNIFLRKQIKKILYKYKITFWEGLIISGDIFIHKSQDINKITKNFPDAIASDMESAAISQICFQYNKPVLIIKIISDDTNKKAPLIFKKSIQNISIQSYKIIEDYINIIKKLYKIGNINKNL